MRKRLLSLFRDTKEKRVWQLLIALIAGVVLMAAGNLAGKGADPIEKKAESAFTYEGESLTEISAYGEALERKLTAALSRAEGVGKVAVVITLKSKGQVELAKDTSYEKTESGPEDTKSVSEKREEKHFLGGDREPIIIKELEPLVEGVLIVAEGGDKGPVKARLTKAAGALLNLPPHKIEVLKMREE